MVMAKRKSAWARKLMAIRERHGLTQASAAARVGVSVATWVSWENNHRKPSGPARALLAIRFPEK